MVTVLPCSFKIFINVFAFLYVKANSKKICEERSFLSFFQKNADVSICVDITKANYLINKANYLEKMRGYLNSIFLCGFQ